MPENTLTKSSLAAKFAAITEPWQPKIVARVNDTCVKLVKFTGPFVWHHHDVEDEMFLVIEGRMLMELRGQEPVELGPGEFITVPAGVEHRPVAHSGEEARVMMIEPASTVNTGSAGGGGSLGAGGGRTVEAEWL